MKSYKTPLRYPGTRCGKSRACILTKMDQYEIS